VAPMVDKAPAMINFHVLIKRARSFPVSTVYSQSNTTELPTPKNARMMYIPPKISACLTALVVFDAVGLPAPALDSELVVVGDVTFADVAGFLFAELPIVPTEPGLGSRRRWRTCNLRLGRHYSKRCRRCRGRPLRLSYV
jgi:hypothetical protein